jgi:hypothetical protein
MDAEDHDDLPQLGDSLDQLLSEARWPVAPPPSVARLTQHWEKVWATRRRHEMLRRRAAVLALAAAVLVVVTIGFYRTRPQEKSITEINRQPAQSSDQSASKVAPETVLKNRQPVETAGHETRRPTMTVQPEASNRSIAERRLIERPQDLAPSRPPNELEAWMLTAADRKQTRASSPKIAVKESTAPKPAPAAAVKSTGDARRAQRAAPAAKSANAALVAAAIKRLVSDPKLDAIEVSADLADAPKSEQLLLETLRRGKVPEQVAALRLLGEVGTSDAVGLVLDAATVPELHPAALGALSQLAEPAVIAELARSEPNADLRRTLLSALLVRAQPASVEQFLGFVINERTADDALAAAQSVKRPPMDLLFACLSEPLVPRRIAAARVIGRIDGDTTTRRLIVMVESGVNRHEACVALLSSRGAAAVRYVGSAERDPTLAGILSGARLFTQADIPPRS